MSKTQFKAARELCINGRNIKLGEIVGEVDTNIDAMCFANAIVKAMVAPVSPAVATPEVDAATPTVKRGRKPGVAATIEPTG